MLQRTSGTQQSRSLASKTGRKKYNKTKKETKEVGRELHPGKGVLKREVSKHQETLSLPNLWRALEAQRAT